MPERGKFRKLFDSTELMCDGFLQSFLILVSSPLVSPPYPRVVCLLRVYVYISRADITFSFRNLNRIQ
jgi:hypothetical protein